MILSEYSKKPNVPLAITMSLLMLLSVGAGWAGSRVRRPDAVVDLRTREGVALINGQWRYADASIVETAFGRPGPDNRPSNRTVGTHDVTPRAGAVGFDDSRWEALDPTTLETRRSTGRLAFNWYRIAVTIPERIGVFDPTGATAVLEIVLDDYAEIWVDGRLPLITGQAGGHLVGGWNVPNRVVLGRNTRPGQKFQLAIFGMNAPVSDPPRNYIWIRSATLDFYGSEHARPFQPVETRIVRDDPDLDAIVPSNARIERLAEGFSFIEGPVWVRGDATDEGYLLFSDPNDNVIYRWTPDGDVSIFRTKSGYTGTDIGEYGQPGSNGLTLDPQGRLTICEHGNRRVTRLEPNGAITVLADRFEGKRLNSPNDLVYRSDGTLYFSDPPFGLPKFHDDPRRELPNTSVFCLKDGRLMAVSNEFTGPNGLALSPDEKYLYVANWDEKKKIVMRYEVLHDGLLANGRVFHDMTSAPGEEALDGLKVDQQGNVFVSGPGGLWILSPAGKRLGMIVGPELPANFAWGDEDGKTLYLAARTSLYRIRLNSSGVRPR